MSFRSSIVSRVREVASFHLQTLGKGMLTFFPFRRRESFDSVRQAAKTEIAFFLRQRAQGSLHTSDTSQPLFSGDVRID